MYCPIQGALVIVLLFIGAYILKDEEIITVNLYVKQEQHIIK
jgi:hypothetical protein